jgi:hypothetical protein
MPLTTIRSEYFGEDRGWKEGMSTRYRGEQVEMKPGGLPTFLRRSNTNQSPAMMTRHLKDVRVNLNEQSSFGVDQ